MSGDYLWSITSSPSTLFTPPHSNPRTFLWPFALQLEEIYWVWHCHT